MFKKISDSIKENGLIYLIIFVCIMLFWLPFIPLGFVNGWEIGFQYARFLTLIQTLQEGIFPAKVRPSHMMGYGYGVGFFYPDFFLYPSAFLAYLGVDPDTANKLFTLLIIFVGTFVAYKLFKDLSGLKITALIGVVLFIGSRINYRNYVQGSGYPHLCAYIFLPLALMGLLNALKDKKEGYIQYAIGITFVVLSHHLIFLTMMMSMLIIVICHIKSIIKNPKMFAKLFGISMVALLFTTAYWLPALEQALHIKLKALYGNAYDITEHILSLNEIFSVFIGPLLFILFFVAVAAFIVLVIKKHKMDTDIWSLFITNLIILFISFYKPLWLTWFGVLFGFMQYTERFIFVMTVMMIIFIVMVLRELYRAFHLTFLDDRNATSVFVVIFSLLLIFVTRWDNKHDFYDLDSYERVAYGYEMLDWDYNVSFAEWLPVECEPTACRTPDTSKADDGSGADGFKHDQYKYYEVWIDLSKEYYDVPYVYYYGYGAYLVDENMNPVQELEVGEALDDNGLLRVYMPQDGEGIGHLMVTYRKTFIQKLSYVISIVTTLAIIAAVGVSMVRKKKA